MKNTTHLTFDQRFQYTKSKQHVPSLPRTVPTAYQTKTRSHIQDPFGLSFDVQNHGVPSRNQKHQLLNLGFGPLGPLLALQQAIVVKLACFKVRRREKLGLFLAIFSQIQRHLTPHPNVECYENSGTKGWSKQPFLSLPCGFSRQVGLCPSTW